MNQPVCVFARTHTHKCIFPFECEKTDSAVKEEDDSPDLHFTRSLHLPGKQTYHCYFQHMHMSTLGAYTVDDMEGLSGVYSFTLGFPNSVNS